MFTSEPWLAELLKFGGVSTPLFEESLCWLADSLWRHCLVCQYMDTTTNAVPYIGHQCRCSQQTTPHWLLKLNRLCISQPPIAGMEEMRRFHQYMTSGVEDCYCVFVVWVLLSFLHQTDSHRAYKTHGSMQLSLTSFLWLCPVAMIWCFSWVGRDSCQEWLLSAKLGMDSVLWTAFT